MISLSVLIIPFLFVIDVLVKSNDMILPIGSRMAVISIAYIWGVYLIFIKTKKRRWLGLALACLLAIPIDILINISVAKLISLPIMTNGDMFEVILLAVLAAGFFVMDYMNQRKSR